MALISISDLVDLSTFDAHGRPGLTYRTIRGVRVVLEWAARRLLCPRDGLPWALGTCIDVPGYVNANMTDSQLATLKATCDNELTRVEYVIGVQSTMVIDVQDVLRYAPRLAIANAGTYPLIVSLNQAREVLVQFPIAA